MIRFFKKIKSNKGFTLIELIVVLAVLAIIMAIAVPRFLGVQQEAKEKADNNSVELIKKAAELYFAAEVDDDNKVTVGELKSAKYLGDVNTTTLTVGDITINRTTGVVTVNTTSIP